MYIYIYVYLYKTHTQYIYVIYMFLISFPGQVTHERSTSEESAHRPRGRDAEDSRPEGPELSAPEPKSVESEGGKPAESDAAARPAPSEGDGRSRTRTRGGYKANRRAEGRQPCQYCGRPVADTLSGRAQHEASEYCLTRKYYYIEGMGWAQAEERAQKEVDAAWWRNQKMPDKNQAPPEPPLPPRMDRSREELRRDFVEEFDMPEWEKDMFRSRRMREENGEEPLELKPAPMQSRNRAEPREESRQAAPRPPSKRIARAWRGHGASVSRASRVHAASVSRVSRASRVHAASVRRACRGHPASVIRASRVLTESVTRVSRVHAAKTLRGLTKRKKRRDRIDRERNPKKGAGNEEHRHARSRCQARKASRKRREFV